MPDSFNSLDSDSQKIIEKYLNNWSTYKETIDFSILSKKRFQNALSIPAFLEHDNIIKQIENLKSIIDSKTLIIYVLNQNTENPSHKKNNGETLSYLKSLGKITRLSKTTDFIEDQDLNIIVVDRFSKPLNFDQGVGTARKIGADIALYLFKSGILTSNILYSSDADSIFPDDYFKEYLSQKESLVHKKFTHIPFELDSEFELKALEAYEYYLNYYPANLKWAGSLYAFPTIGSCFVISLLAYAKVRGFPQKQAGEDFYLANKLAKVGLIRQSDISNIELQGRKSSRVPFGTGPSIIEISETLKNGADYLIPSHECFKYLRSALLYAESYLRNGSKEALPKNLRAILEKSKFFTQLDKANLSSPNVTIKIKNFNDWFDGLRQLQLINELSRNTFPMISHTKAEHLDQYPHR